MRRSQILLDRSGAGQGLLYVGRTSDARRRPSAWHGACLGDHCSSMDAPELSSDLESGGSFR